MALDISVIVSGLIDRPESQCDILQRLTSGQLTKHQVKAMAVAVRSCYLGICAPHPGTAPNTSRAFCHG